MTGDSTDRSDRCACCGLGNVSTMLCGHCRKAHCSIFGDDKCNAAGRDVDLGGATE